MKNYSKVGGRIEGKKGRPGYRTPSRFFAKKAKLGKLATVKGKRGTGEIEPLDLGLE